MRGVAIGAGAHRIEMRYSPWTVWAGAALTLAGAGLTALVVRLDNRNKL